MSKRKLREAARILAGVDLSDEANMKFLTAEIERQMAYAKSSSGKEAKLMNEFEQLRKHPLAPGNRERMLEISKELGNDV